MEKLVTWNVEGITYTGVLCTTQKERDLCYQLRFEEFCRPPKIRLPPENYPDGREFDEFDNHSWHILAFKEGVSKPVGTFRLIDCSEGCLMFNHSFNGKPFSLPSEFNDRPIHPKTTAEAARWVGHADTLPNGKRVLISYLLIETAIKVSQQAGITHWIFAVEINAVRNLRNDGWPLKQIVPGTHQYYNSLVEVCILELKDDFFYRHVIDC